MRLDGWEIKRADEMPMDAFKDPRIILETESRQKEGFWLFPPNGAYAIWASLEGIGTVLSDALDREKK